MTSVKSDTQGLGITFQLGTDYEKKKQQLLQELQLDYKEYVAKKKDVKKHGPHLQQHGLSLPIDERVSVKERLREERNKEYNLFLQEQAKIRKLKGAIPSFTFKSKQVQTSDAANVTSQDPLFFLDTHNNIPTPNKEHPASRRDAATLTEAIDNGRNTGAWNPGPRTRRRWHIHRPKESQSSAEELNTDEEEELDFRTRRRRRRWIQEPEFKEERKANECQVNRAFQDITEVESPVVQNNNERIWKSYKQMPESMMTAARSTSVINKDNSEFATGLMIGTTEEQSVTQMRKEQYRQELLRQIAEQQRNRIKEKKLELRVSATGAADPEKESDQLKHFGAAYQQYGSLRRDVPHETGKDLESAGKNPNPRPKNDKPFENIEQRAPPGRFQADYGTALSKLPRNTVPGMGVVHAAPPLDCFSEDYHRDLRGMLGEVAIQRVSGVAPPAPPVVPNPHSTPYDAAYYHYGARDPLDLNSLQNQNCLHGGAQQPGIYAISPQMAPPFRANGCIESCPLGFERLHADTSKQRRASVLSYQESLRQQMKEREEHKKREKEEKKRFDAKIEAEIMAYNPWGRGGAGAPIKDQNGNLVSDLNQMHKINNSSMSSPGVEGRTFFSHQLSGFGHYSPLQQLQTQNSYKEDLKQQIEERKRKQAEEREQRRIAEEKEEERLAKERARMQLQYEEEQRKQKKRENNLKIESHIHEPKTHYKEKVKCARQEKEMIPESTRAKDEKYSQLINEREPSPPIPTLQRKQKNVVISRPFSAVSELSSRTNNLKIESHIHEPKTHYKEKREPSPPIPTLQRRKRNVISRPFSAVTELSSRTEQSVSAPYDRPVTERISALNDGQKQVIKELSGLRRYLRKEQRKLDLQMDQTGPQETYYSHSNRRRPRVDAFECASKEAVESSARSPFHGAACVNKENIKEFNQLKYRGTISPEKVCATYPDPPCDTKNLDIQQQALLHEQQHKIRLLNRQKEHDCYKGDADDGQVYRQGSAQPSAEHSESQRRLNCEDIYDSVRLREQEDQSDNQSLLSFKAGSLNKRQHSEHGAHNSKSGLTGDEEDVLSLRSSLGRCVSVETVATEPWLRPGTSDAAKQLREKPNSGTDAAL